MSKKKPIILKERLQCSMCGKEISGLVNPGDEAVVIMDSKGKIYESYACFDVIRRNESGGRDLTWKEVLVRYSPYQSELARRYHPV